MTKEQKMIMELVSIRWRQWLGVMIRNTIRNFLSSLNDCLNMNGYFCRKMSENALGVIIHARGCHMPAFNYRSGVNY